MDKKQKDKKKVRRKTNDVNKEIDKLNDDEINKLQEKEINNLHDKEWVILHEQDIVKLHDEKMNKLNVKTNMDNLYEREMDYIQDDINDFLHEMKIDYAQEDINNFLHKRMNQLQGGTSMNPKKWMKQ